jgi:hypothetical protein
MEAAAAMMRAILATAAIDSLFTLVSYDELSTCVMRI